MYAESGIPMTQAFRGLLPPRVSMSKEKQSENNKSYFSFWYSVLKQLFILDRQGEREKGEERNLGIGGGAAGTAAVDVLLGGTVFRVKVDNHLDEISARNNRKKAIFATIFTKKFKAQERLPAAVARG
ncbi:hypothetical protein Fcan01_18567 [Folsomia candida]|uniref:Uncharacterized protein n=1 Tax=Folsomia candida TaxID=158441 RepID=A0A226DLQ7_FOLCA|nr:hypothetical protein Fcan01_18567 [Folsomia candida]